MSKGDDEIVDEIRRVREAYAASFGYDVHRMGEDLRRQERESGAKTVRLQPRKPRRAPRAAKPA